MLPGNSPFVLLIDDDDDDLFFLIDSIRRVDEKATIVTKLNGKLALSFLEELCRENTSEMLPHWIFLDLNMTMMSGRQTIQVLKKSTKYCHIPVVILTTSTNERDREELIAMGADDYYIKPPLPDDFAGIYLHLKNKYFKNLKQVQRESY